MDLLNLSQIGQEYQTLSQLYAAQPDELRETLIVQAWELVSALDRPGGRFQLKPPQSVHLDDGTTVPLPPRFSRLIRLTRLGGSTRLQKRERIIRQIQKMAQTPRQGPALYARLFAFAVADQVVHHFVPDGQPVRYLPEAYDDIPCIPLVTTTSSSPYASRFFLTEMVAFGEDNQLLAGSTAEAETILAGLKYTFTLIEDAEAFLPCVVADEAYQVKRAGLLGQLVNQGYALARYQTAQIIERMHQRANLGELDRKLILKMPFFDVSDLSMHLHTVNIIPSGLSPFLPAFVVRAMQLAAWKVERAAGLHASTRRHLLAQFAAVEDSFNQYLEN